MSNTLLIENSPDELTEISGFLCGFICGGTHSEGKLWLESLMGYMKETDIDFAFNRDTLIELYKQLSHDIQNDKMRFTLNFPKSELPLDKRAIALKRWCNGFIAGLQQAGIRFTDEDNQNELTESLKKIDYFAKLELNKIDVNEEDEAMFSQIVHFIEFAVTHIFQILNHGAAKH